MSGLLHMSRIRSILITLCLSLGFSNAAVIVKTGNYTLSPIIDMPADFGPSLNDAAEGQLVLADPEDGCQPLAVPPIRDEWIALIARSQSQNPRSCSFNVKVENAEAAGAAAVIIYDNVYEPLVIMAKPLGAVDPGIPSVFISQKAGILLKKLVEAGLTYTLIIPTEESMWMSVLLSSLAGVSCVTFVVAAFLYISHRQRLRSLPNQGAYRLLADEGMTPAELRALPVIVFDPPQKSDLISTHPSQGWSEEEKGESDSSGSDAGGKGGGTRKTCAVCLEDYRDGEKLRVLPCQHRFHMECIDQWLSSRKPLCPICKWDAKEEFIVTASEQVQGEPLPAPQPQTSRRWRWSWGNSIAQFSSPPSVPENIERSSSSPIQAQNRPAVNLWRPNFGFRSTPHNFPNMHAVSIQSASEEV